MNVTVAVEPDPEFPAGHAVVRLRGAAAFAGPFGFRIRRDDFDDSVFGLSGWQVADAVLTPGAKSIDGDDLLLHIGPSVVQHIVSGVYHFALPAANFEMPVFWPDLPLLSDAAQNMVAEPARAAQRAASANPAASAGWAVPACRTGIADRAGRTVRRARRGGGSRRRDGPSATPTGAGTA